jgi:hypothetical protein
MKRLRTLSFVILVAAFAISRTPVTGASGCNIEWHSPGTTAENAEQTCNSFDCDFVCSANQPPESYNGVGCEEQYTGHGAPQCSAGYQVGPGQYQSDGVCTCGY